MQNKPKVIKCASCALAATLLIGNSTTLATSNLEQQLNQTRSNLTDVQEQISSDQSAIESLESNLDSSKQNQSDVNYELQVLNDERLSLEEKIYEINSQIQTTVNKIFDLESQIVDITNELEIKAIEIQETKDSIEKNTQLLIERLRISYKMGDVRKIEILMTSIDINDFLSRNKMITTVTEYDNELINKLNEDKARLEVLQMELNGQKASLEIAKENAEAAKVKLDEQKAIQEDLLEQIKIKESENYELLASINTQIQSFEKSLNEKIASKNILSERQVKLTAEISGIERKINEENERIERERKEREERERREREERERRAREAKEQAEREAAVAAEREAQSAKERAEAEERRRKEEVEKQKSELETKKAELEEVKETYEKVERNDTTYAWPAASYRITSYFGPRRAPARGASTYHRGIDIAGGHGTAIYATASGVVSRRYYTSGGGNQIEINHGNGVKSVYKHLSSYNVSVGQSVLRGQRIARMGNTGISTGPHLHFEIMINGTQVNPLPYIR